jgi:general secretion pathway protein I
MSRRPPKGPVPGADGGFPSRAGRRLQGGFSLLEVVVAFAILAISLGVLLQIFSSAINATALSGTYSRAAALAEERLNSVGLEIPLEIGSDGGETNEGFRWQLIIDYYDMTQVDWAAPVEPYLVTSVVSWETAQGTREVALSTLRLGEPL